MEFSSIEDKKEENGIQVLKQQHLLESVSSKNRNGKEIKLLKYQACAFTLAKKLT
jgi:hypothetical protein